MCYNKGLCPLNTTEGDLYETDLETWKGEIYKECSEGMCVIYHFFVCLTCFFDVCTCVCALLVLMQSIVCVGGSILKCAVYFWLQKKKIKIFLKIFV